MSHPWAWEAIVALGLFHGINPGMGWLFAVSNGMQARSGYGLLRALPPLAAGHLLAMAIVLLPVAVVDTLVSQARWLQAGMALLLIGFGLYKVVRPRPPRYLSRVGPGRLTLWSFLMASAHGAGFMLIPVFFDLMPAGGHGTMAMPMQGSVAIALAAVALHTVAMITATAAVAWLVYRYLGLRLLGRAWFNFDLMWAAALIAVGALALLI